MPTCGPSMPFSQELHQTKYQNEGEGFDGYTHRVASYLCDDNDHYRTFRPLLADQSILPAGRIQLGAGSPRAVTLYNCFVLPDVPDSTTGIMHTALQAAQTMRMGGGVGYSFSGLRHRGAMIKSLGSPSTGPVPWMGVFDALCFCISSAGHRRGAQMAVLRCDHPDIMEFITAKQDQITLRGFNLSVAVTDELMQAVAEDKLFALRFNGVIVKWVEARELWRTIMESTWDWAEPGVLFIDTINRMNNLWYCEKISATNPCAEQPLPPHGACLLASINLPKFLVPNTLQGTMEFDWDRLDKAIPALVRAMDNVVDKSLYPLPEQETEAKEKRRMGMGVTGLANCIEALGHPYGSPGFVKFEDDLLRFINHQCYEASIVLAQEKGSFPMFDPELYAAGNFIKTLGEGTQWRIARYGIRNSHLTSIAPTGTISMAADNVSSGVEPVFSYGFNRDVIMPQGKVTEKVEDYGKRVLGVSGKVSADVSVDEHLAVLLTAQKHVDSSVSKTVNHGPDMPWHAFEGLYRRAWEGGAKGCATFNSGGKRAGILVAEPDVNQEPENPQACFIDLLTGTKSCA
jgi:ribonucleoside-diphosphate reductase alpha chain